MTPNVPTSDSGTATLGIAVARTLRRNTNTTAVTSSTLSRRVISTSRTDARMVVVRSIASVMSIAGEIACFSWGRAAFTPSMVRRMFAPGCRRMIIRTARFPSIQAARRLFSTSSITRATCPSRTPAPFWYETTSWLYASAPNSWLFAATV